jgi:hypothetical protein
MPNSQFHSPARIQSDGRIRVSGDQQVSPLTGEQLEYRFLLVQGDVVVKGSGLGHGSTWTGLTEPGEGPLQVGSVLALGLGLLPRRAPRPGYETFTWSDQIELVYG